MNGFILYRGPDNIEVRLMLEKAAELSINLEVVDPHKLTVLLDHNNKELLLDGKPVDLPDFALAAFARDPSYTNIALLQQLETLGVFCVNRASVLKLTGDKLLSLQTLASKGIPIPKTMLLTPTTTMDLIKQEFSFPLVIKTIGGSKGSGVALATDEKHLKNILTIARGGNITQELIIQEMISTSKGHDLRVTVSGGRSIACLERVAANSDEFRSNFSLGGSASNVKLTPKIEEITNRTAEALGLFIGGVDLLFTDDGFVVCEANSVPGFHLPGYPDVWKMNIPEAVLRDIKSTLLNTRAG
jgi:gamma-F420-2:alpha-L-glutamate ligase